jgi:hypothetical protein
MVVFLWIKIPCGFPKKQYLLYQYHCILKLIGGTMSRIMTLVMAASLCMAVLLPAQDKTSGNLAVTNFDVFLTSADLGKAVADMLSTQLAASGQLHLVERTRLAKILEEQKLSMSGIVNPDQAVTTGQVSGAEYVIIGSVGKLGLVIVLNARKVHTQSGNVTQAWSLTGKQEAELPQMVQQLAEHITGKRSPGKDPADIQAGATGYWISEWYDVNGKHPGSIYLQQKGSKITGWTVEPIGPAEIIAKIKDRTIKGKYKAGYGDGNFEFTLSPDNQRLIGSYSAGHGAKGTWMAWRRAQPAAKPIPGARVLADWSRDIWTYPGTISKVKGDKVYITYDDGDAEWLSLNRVYPLDLASGDIVFTAQAHKKGYTSCTIVEMKDNRALVQYQDQAQKWEPIAKMRVLRVRSRGY